MYDWYCYVPLIRVILLLIVVPQFVLIEQSFMKNLVFWNKFFKKKEYPLSFIDNYFKIFVDKLFIKHPQLTTVKKKTLFLSLPYLGEISLQIRTKLGKFLKGLLNSCKLQIVFKSQRKLSNVFLFKDRLLFDFVSRLVYKYMFGRCNFYLL